MSNCRPNETSERPAFPSVEDKVMVRSRSEETAEPVSRVDLAARAVLERRRLPAATYRLQFNPSFTFADARGLIPYLSDLGVTDVYASPLLRACAGSTHGYDVCDHRTINPMLGSSEELDALTDELRRRKMGLIFDVVPNHMGIADPANAWWMDVLEDGPSSAYASYFDVDWHPLRAEADLENKVLLPILGDPYGKALEDQHIRLVYEDGAFFIAYFDHRMPVTPRSYAEILGARLDEVATMLGEDNLHLLELQSIITAIHHLPLETDTNPEPTTTAGAAIRAASTRWTGCWVSSAIASPTGGSPPRRSTTGASSTSTTWRQSAWKTRSCLPRPTALSCGWSARERPPACGSTTPTACGTRPPTCASSSGRRFAR
jgi:hypothetical protein